MALPWKRLITIMSLLVIGLSFLQVSIAVVKIVSGSFASNLYSISNLERLLSEIFPIHSQLLMAPLILGAIMIFKKKMTLWHVAIALLFSFFIPSYELFDEHIHTFLFSLHLYDFLLQPGQQVLNPQYSRILFFVLLFSILLIQCVVKKTRSVDKIFITLILGVVLITTMIFHIALPMGMFKIAKHEAEQVLMQNVQNYNENSLCFDKHCYYLDHNFNVIKAFNNTDMNILKNYQYVLPSKKNEMEYKHVSIISASLGNFKEKGFAYMIFAMKKIPDGYFVVIDEDVLKKTAKHNEIWFSFLSTMAHGLWFYGGIFLLFLHKQVMFRKLSPRLQKLPEKV